MKDKSVLRLVWLGGIAVIVFWLAVAISLVALGWRLYCWLGK